MKILGISAYYHDAAAALLVDGKAVAAAQEERFTRKRHDSSFPSQASRYCLKEARISAKDLDAIVFYDKPLLKFERLLETYLAFAPKGLVSFLASMPAWLGDKLLLKTTLKDEICKLGEATGGMSKAEIPELLFTEHHQSHAASTFFPSPFQSAAVMCLDGVGEWATTSVWKGDGHLLKALWEIDFPHSLGLLYSAFTYYTGFKVNSGEYKLMGLAPYGEPKYTRQILDNLLDLKEDGTFRLNMDYFEFATGLKMTNQKFAKLFGEPVREVDKGKLTQFHMDIARSIQWVTEEVVLRLARTVQKETGEDYLCLAGGVALNCVANGRLLREGPFKDIWIQPAAGDAGGALGAAFAAWHQYYGKPREVPTQSGKIDTHRDLTQGSYLGPSYSNDEIREQLDAFGAKVELLQDDALYDRVAKVLEDGAVVGWMQGRMEFGPRALGARSIIGDPRNMQMQATMNLKIKYRESFRPFAPAVLAEDVSKYFDHEGPSPYMLFVAPVKESLRIQMTAEQEKLFGIEKLNIPRSSLPSITHVDYSARIQTVHDDTNPRFYRLLQAFKKRTGCSVLVNTSFNVRGEPIVCTATDAYRCFMRTEMEYLVVGNYLLAKTAQPHWEDKDNWKEEFQLD